MGSPGAPGNVYLGFVVVFPSLLFSLCLLLAVDLCVRLGSCLLFLLSAVKFLVRPRLPLSLSSVRVLVPRVSRLILALAYSDYVQCGHPVDLCVRERVLRLAV